VPWKEVVAGRRAQKSAVASWLMWELPVVVVIGVIDDKPEQLK